MRGLNAAISAGAFLAGGVIALAGLAPVAAAAPRPAASPRITQLNGVACTSRTACVAVGSSGSRTSTTALAETWNGVTWKIQHVPGPAGASSSALYGVACTSPGSCIAVGNSRHSRVTAALAERWDGKKWAIQPIPRPHAATDAELFGVSCSSRAACTAVGDTNFGASLAERWNGRKWTAQPTPRPHGARYRFTYLYSVSCPSHTACTAVGASGTGLPFTPKNTTFLSLAERWNGRKWAVQRTPRPAAPVATFLYGVRCTSQTTCTAVGTTALKTTLNVVLALRWNGGKWSATSTPNPSPGPEEFSGISCPATRVCIAVGDQSAGGFNVVAEKWNGTSWALTPVIKPQGQFYAALYGVSCTGPSMCMAVGQQDNGSGTPEFPLAERWNGASWTVQHALAP